MTFCNQNRVNCEKVWIELERDNDNLTQNILLWMMENVCRELSPGHGQSNRTKRESTTSMETPNYLESEYTFVKQYMSLFEDTRRSLGHDFDSLIKSCTFRGKNCLNIRSLSRIVMGRDLTWSL